ncbi:MAG: hypothetical protein IT371_12515 [Deltaproteobacteria bacterium]|nr:hypothetical protein [Deltaproteobacteria bacterium]
MKRWLLAFPLLLWPALGQAQELDIAVTVSSGSGMSLGKGEGTVLKQRSPVFIEADVGLIFDKDRLWEWTPSLILEVEGRVSVGINPSVKRVFHFSRVPIAIYGGIGVPFFFAPFTLLGAEAAVGAFYRFLPHLGVALELRTDVFFVGGDLPDGGVLAKLDAALGLRFTF